MHRKRKKCGLMKRLTTALLCVGMLVCMTATALAAGTATLTIAPDVTTAKASGSEVKVVYTISVAPPKGQEIGVFSFRLKAPDGMTLPTHFKENGEQVIQYAKNGLPYNAITETGMFKTYEYTPSSVYFAAVGSMEDNRMTAAAQILTITATIAANKSGTFVLDAEFLAAKDGSGDTYTAKVVTTPVVITDSNRDTGGGTSQDGTTKDERPSGGTPETGTEKPEDTPQHPAQPSAPDAGAGTSQNDTAPSEKPKDGTPETGKPGDTSQNPEQPSAPDAGNGTSQSDTAPRENQKVGTPEIGKPWDTSQYPEQPSVPDTGSDTATNGNTSVTADNTSVADNSIANVGGTISPQERTEEANPGDYVGAVVALILGVIAAVGMLCQTLLPKGLAGLFYKKK